MTTSQKIMGELIIPAVLGSAIVWTLTAIAESFSGNNLQTDLLKVAFALIPAFYTVVPFLMIRLASTYKAGAIGIDLFQAVLIFGIYYSLGLVTQKNHESPSFCGVYACIGLIALSSLSYRDKIKFIEWGPRVIIIFILFVVAIVGVLLLIIGSPVWVHWVVWISMFSAFSIYLCRVVSELVKADTVKG